MSESHFIDLYSTAVNTESFSIEEQAVNSESFSIEEQTFLPTQHT